MTGIRRRWIPAAAAAAVLLTGATVMLRSQRPQASRTPESTLTPGRTIRIEAVSALGHLEPAGDVRKLAAPMSGMAGAPRITQLFVAEGQRVSSGQLLATFDNAATLKAERSLLLARIDNLNNRIALRQRETQRYRNLAQAGATSSSEMENREISLLDLQGDLKEARASLTKVSADLANTELRAPIQGQVLRINSRVGERPSDKGVLELGDSDRMQAVVEVYESDINRVRIAQSVRLTSENGGFEGALRGVVERINPQVRQRDVLSTDPTGDADARIVEVRVRLDRADAQRVRSLTGLKVIARIGV
ncbi:MAG: HlyD family efflux transporter periplasmic adaptor subunit [Cyanobacteriota bacterium]